MPSQLTRRHFAGTMVAGAGLAEGDVLATLKRSHPRLMADERTFASLKRLIESEPAAKRCYQAVREDADNILKEAPSIYEIPDGLRLLSVSRRVKERVQALALVYRLEGGQRYRDRAWKELETAAQFKDWNPKHFLDTAEMTYAFALAYDWLFADWTASQRQTLRQAIVTLGLKPGMAVYASANGWHKRDNNWNQVCNGGLGIGALAIADEEPELARAIIENARQSLPRAMGHYAPDGAGTEGATYWDYGARFNILFLASLETALGTDFELSKIEGFAQSGLYQIYMGGADRMSFDFADCGLRRLSTPMHFWMGRRFRRPEYNWFRSSELARPKQDGGFLDLLWFDANSGFDPARLPLDKHFRAAECVSMRSSWTDPNALVLAIQAGDNSNLGGHRHLDLGTFILEASGERWIIDGGVDHETYLAHQHHNPKWHYYRIRAEGHNTLAINPGPDPDQDLKAVARIVQFDSRPQRTTAVVDLTAAYARHARGVQRTFTMENRSAVTVADRVQTNAPADVWWFAHTPAEVALGADRTEATLTRNGKRLLAKIESPAGAVFEVQEAAPLATSPNPEKQASNRGRRKLAIRLRAVKEAELRVRFAPASA